MKILFVITLYPAQCNLVSLLGYDVDNATALSQDCMSCGTGIVDIPIMDCRSAKNIVCVPSHNSTPFFHGLTSETLHCGNCPTAF